MLSKSEQQALLELNLSNSNFSEIGLNALFCALRNNVKQALQVLILNNVATKVFLFDLSLFIVNARLLLVPEKNW